MADLHIKETVDPSARISSYEDQEYLSVTTCCTLRNKSQSSSIVIDQSATVKSKSEKPNCSLQSVSVYQSKTKERTSNKNRSRKNKQSRHFDLSIISETTIESDSAVNNITKARQPLQEIDVNSFNDEQRKLENEKNLSENSIVLKLASDNDQENLPITLRKRSIVCPTHVPTSKRQKKTIEKVSEIK